MFAFAQQNMSCTVGITISDTFFLCSVVKKSVLLPVCLHETCIFIKLQKLYKIRCKNYFVIQLFTKLLQWNTTFSLILFYFINCTFLSVPATKAFSPPPLGLVAMGTFFPYIKKVLFSQWHTRLLCLLKGLYKNFSKLHSRFRQVRGYLIYMVSCKLALYIGCPAYSTVGFDVSSL